MIGLLSEWYSIDSRVCILQPAVDIIPQISDASLTIEIRSLLNLSPKFSYANESCNSNTDFLFLLVAGLRPVKDVLFLVNCISEWHKKDPRVHLVTILKQILFIF